MKGVRAVPAGFHGWRIVAVLAIGQPLGMGFLGIYQVIVTPLMAEFGASTTQMGLGMTVMILTMGVVGAFLGPVVDKGPLRTIMLTGVAGMVGSMWLLSQASTLWQLALFGALGAASTSLYGQVTANALLVNWFVARRGRAPALAAMGLSVGGMALPPLATWLVDTLGWREALRGLAAGSAVILVPLFTRWVVKRPEDMGQLPDGQRVQRALREPGSGESHDRSAADGSVRKLLQDPNFWLFSLGFGLAMAVPIAASVFLFPFLEALGIERAQVAWAPSTMAAFAFCIKPVVGALVDRSGPRWIILAVLIIYAASWLLLAYSEDLVSVLIASGLMGVGAGSLFVLIPVQLGRCFDRRVIGRVSGLYVPLGMPFTLAAAPLVGYFGQLAGGFRAPFIGLAGVLAVAALLLFFIRERAPEDQWA